MKHVKNERRKELAVRKGRKFKVEIIHYKRERVWSFIYGAKVETSSRSIVYKHALWRRKNFLWVFFFLFHSLYSYIGGEFEIIQCPVGGRGEARNFLHVSCLYAGFAHLYWDLNSRCLSPTPQFRTLALYVGSGNSGSPFCIGSGTWKNFELFLCIGSGT